MKCITKLGSRKITVRKLLEKYKPDYGGYKQVLFERAWKKFSLNPDYENIVIETEKYQCKDIMKISCSLHDKENPVTIVEAVGGFFDYSERSDAEKEVWYLNFADKFLFGFYDSDMFGQDEIQTLEHPALAAVREWLDSKKYKGYEALTITDRQPTPFLVRNVPWWINVNTHDYPIYGWKFGDACQKENYPLLDQAVTVRQSDQLNNIIAMAAPACGKGIYSESQISEALSAAMAGFGGAVENSRRNGKRTVIHSGRWGAGAFGGNEELLLAVQIIAARIVGVDHLVLHAVNEECLENASRLVAQIEETEIQKAINIVQHIHSKKYMWGLSDGN